MQRGNSFQGVLAEFNSISVDKFNTGASTFLLTHFHADHLAGLDAKSFCKKVYCTPTTRALLALNPAYHHILLYVIPLDYGKHSISVNGLPIELTLIQSYHCPGSTMFLVEDKVKAVLITGDIRAESWWVQGLAKNPYLFQYTTGLKVLANIYLDTTFSYRGEPYIEMSDNNDGINGVIQMLRSYPQDDEEIQFFFMDTTSGFEEAWAKIVPLFLGSLTLGADLRARISALCQQNDSSAQILSQSIGKTHYPRFHVIAKAGNHKPNFAVTIKQCIDFNISDMAGILFPIPVNSLTETERATLRLVHSTAKGNEIYRFKNRLWILPKGGSEYLPKEIKLVFSRHLSFSESRKLVSLFRPKEVYPCCESKTTWLSGFSVERIFGDLCISREFKYDLMMFNKFGRPSLQIQERPVMTINRWSFEE
ncbi:uncharacterized protein CANTADRAFT_30341, partial [Suhomyces tanzawaensis NRRL Y-17324]